MQTAYDLVWLAAERTPDHMALVDDLSNRSFTYRQLIEEVDAVAAGLAARGVGKGTRVATVLPSNLEHCLVLLALQRLTAVPALLNARLNPEEIAQLIARGGLEGAVVLCASQLVEVVAEALPGGSVLFSVGGATERSVDFAECRGDRAILPPVPRPDPEDPAFIFYTSGTTGLPKGVVVAHRTSEHRIVWLSPLAGLMHGTHNRALGFMPLSHAIGFYGVFLVTLAYNGTYYVMSAFDPAEVVTLIERHKITYLFAVPTHYHAIVSATNYSPERMASLQLVLFGGSPMPGPLLDRMASEWPATFRHIYGITESMVSFYNPAPVGQPALLRPGYYTRARAVRIGAGPEDIVAPDEEGELILDASGDMMFSGYLNRPDATAAKIRDGWYFTDDICVMNERGEMVLKGRVDDMIRSGGESVHPEEVEATLNAHPGVKESAVVGVADARWGQLVAACVVAREDGASAADLDAHCRAGTLAGYKRPRGYVFVDELPRNAANKVLRRVLREKAEKARNGEGEIAYHSIEIR